MSLFTNTSIGKCLQCGAEVSLNTVKSHPCNPKNPPSPETPESGAVDWEDVAYEAFDTWDMLTEDRDTCVIGVDRRKLVKVMQDALAAAYERGKQEQRSRYGEGCTRERYRQMQLKLKRQYDEKTKLLGELNALRAGLKDTS